MKIEDPLVLEGADLHDAIVMAARNVLESEIESRRIASTWFLYALFGPGHAFGMKPLSIPEVEHAAKRVWGEKHYDVELTYNLKSVLVDILTGDKAPDFALLQYKRAP
ncbi:MAG: hypothetical protein M3463_15160 [Verrucomicrobiota bacterium]|nr:hypothetical protein [Verrucomicrobiota bacterium]